MAAENIRGIVLSMLLTVEKEEAYSHLLVKDVLEKYDYLPGQEKAFLKRLFEGTLERRIELDYYINQFASLPVRKMKPLIRNILRMSAYQILFMDSVPDFAAINEAVKLTDKHKFHNLKGFVNGVLRKLSGGKETLKKPDKKNKALYLSVTYSMPEWLVKHFLTEYSFEETEQIFAAFMQVRPVTMRFRLGLSDKEKEAVIRGMEEKGCVVEQHAFFPMAYYLKNCENVTELPGFAEGLFTLQDVSSMEAVLSAGIKPGDKVLDICAAPGGKTVLAAELATEKGQVLSRDVSEKKTVLIEDYVNRMGLNNVTVEAADATVFDASLENTMDVVLADVPCSGLGVMGRKRDIKYRQKEEALTELPKLQKEIVKNAVRYVKPGGILLYSTCTLNRAENEDMAAFIEKELLMKPVLKNTTAEKGYVRLTPHVQDTDGFFFARFRKEEK